MIMYASRTGTRRSLDEFRARGWRILISATGSHRSEGLPYAIDNGAWTAHQQGTPFDAALFERLLESHGAGADWIVVPDCVGDAARSLDMAREWIPRLGDLAKKSLVVIQDGAKESDMLALAPAVRGFFLGGSTEYKLQTMERWGKFCRSVGAYYHIGRVNSRRRIAQAMSAGADSVDGTSGTRFADTIPRLDAELKQGSFKL